MRITARKSVRISLVNTPSSPHVEWGPEDWVEVVPLGHLSSADLDAQPKDQEKLAEWHLERLVGGEVHIAETKLQLPDDMKQLPLYARWHIYNTVLMQCWRGNEFDLPPSPEEVKNDGAPSPAA